MTSNALHRTLFGKSPNKYDLVRCLAGAILWFGAATKGYQVATEPIEGSKWFAVFAVQYEWWLGLWLFSGLFPRLARLAALATFGLFSVVSGYLAIQGAESCGCFGGFHVDPRITVTMDLLVVACMVAVSPPAIPRRRVSLKWACGAMLVGGVVASAALWFMVRYEPARLAHDGRVLGDAREVFLEPSDWLGKPCPLLGLPGVDDRLARDKWVVLLHHATCTGCRGILADWPKSVLQHASDSKPAIISVSASVEDYPPNTLRSRLPNTHQWFIPSPTVLCLDSGIVTKTIVQGDVSSAAAGVSPSLGPKKSNEDQSAPDASKPSSKTLKSILASGVEHDLEFIEPKSLHRVVFVLKNPSDHDWKIKSTRSECDCMKCVDPPQKILAGKTAQITVEFKAPDTPQDYSKRIVVFTEDEKAPHHKFCLRARIGLPLHVVPSAVSFDKVAPGEQYEHTVDFVNDGKVPVKVLYAISTDPACHARVPHEAIPPGGRIALPIILRPGSGPLTKPLILRLHTNCPVQQVVPISIKTTPQDG